MQRIGGKSYQKVDVPIRIWIVFYLSADRYKWMINEWVWDEVLHIQSRNKKNPNEFRQLNQQKYGIIDAIRFFAFMGSFFKSVILR